jgi:glycosyltransferase involved in cell wall biosynthesis
VSATTPRPTIGYLLKRFPRLSETFVLNEMLGLEREGWPLHVMSRRPPEMEPRHPEIDRLRASVTTLTVVDPWPTLISTGGQRVVLPRVKRLVEGAEVWRHALFPQLLAEALHLLPIVEQRRIRHLHVHFATDSLTVAALLRELGGPSYSVTLHAKDIYRDGVDFERLDRLVSESALAVTVCDANVEFLSRRLSECAMARVRRLYNGVDLTAYVPRRTEFRDRSHLLAVGRLVEKKGFDVFLRALWALERQGVVFDATLVGDGLDRPRLDALANELGLADRVRFAGALDQAEVRELMSRATVLCQPCVVGADGNQDALPTVLLEALACGLPVVTTPVGGIPEIVDGGGAGLLVPSGDVEATAAALALLLSEPLRRAALAAKGRRRAEALFDGAANTRVLSGWLAAPVKAAPTASPIDAIGEAVSVPTARSLEARDRSRAR